MERNYAAFCVVEKMLQNYFDLCEMYLEFSKNTRLFYETCLEPICLQVAKQCIDDQYTLNCISRNVPI